jgi:hypothetical protein
MSLPDLHSTIRVCPNIPVQAIAGSQAVSGENHPDSESQYIYLRDCHNAYLAVNCGELDSHVQVKLQHCEEISAASPTWNDVVSGDTWLDFADSTWADLGEYTWLDFAGDSDVISDTESGTLHIYQINLRGREDGPYYRASLYSCGGTGASTVSATFLAAWPKDNLLGGDLAVTAIDATW